MGTPTRFTYGIGTVPKTQPLGGYPLPDPFHTSATVGLDVTSYANDFFTIGSTTLDFTITGASSTFTTADGVGGVALVTPGGTTTVSTVALAHSAFQFVSGQKFWYVCRIKASAVAGTVAFQFGLHKGTGATPTDGIYFQKAASSTSLNLISRVNSTNVTLATGITTAAADTYIDVAFYYDGTDLLVYTNDNLVARVANVVVSATSSATAITNALLQPAFQITPTATDTLSIDYVLAAQETSR